MAKLIIGMGLPGAGKSKVLKEFADKYGHTYVSVDDVREKHGLTVEEPSTEREWDDIRSQALESYRAGRSVVVDGTFLGDIRKRFIDFARHNGVEKIQGLLVDTPEEIAWERNQQRGRQVPREVFNNRLDHLKNFPPEITDGLDAIFSVNENGELTEAELPEEQRREFVPRNVS